MTSPHTARHDPYPSRTGPAWTLEPRIDPVVWDRTPRPGPLSDDQLARFARDGFLLLPEWLSPEEAQRMREAADRLAADPSRAPHAVTEPGQDVVRSVFAPHLADDTLAAAAAHPRLRGAARQIVGGTPYVYQSRVNYKRALSGAPFSWHSDFETWHVEDGMPRIRAVSASVALSPTHPLNGGLRLLRGSHARFVGCPGETPEDHYRQSLKVQQVGSPPAEALKRMMEEGELVVVEGDPGTVVLFDANTLHASAANLSPEDRVGLFVVYNHVDNAPGEPFGGTRPRPWFLAHRPGDDPALKGPQGC